MREQLEVGGSALRTREPGPKAVCCWYLLPLPNPLPSALSCLAPSLSLFSGLWVARQPWSGAGMASSLHTGTGSRWNPWLQVSVQKGRRQHPPHSLPEIQEMTGLGERRKALLRPRATSPPCSPAPFSHQQDFLPCRPQNLGALGLLVPHSDYSDLDHSGPKHLAWSSLSCSPLMGVYSLRRTFMA